MPMSTKMVSYSLESNLNKQARMNIVNNLPRGESIAKNSYNHKEQKKYSTYSTTLFYGLLDVYVCYLCRLVIYLLLLYS